MEEMSEEMRKKLRIATPEEERAYNVKRAEEAVWHQLQEKGFVDREAPLTPSVKFKELRKNERGMEQIDVVFLTGPSRDGLRAQDLATSLAPSMTQR